MNNANDLLKKDRLWGIFIIIIFAMFGHLSSFLLLSSNLKQPDGDLTINVIQNDTNQKLYEVNKDTLTVNEKELVKSVTIQKKELLYNRNPNFLIWITLILTMVTIASASFPVFIWQIIRLKATFKLNYKHILQAVLFATSIVLFIVVILKSTTGFYVPSKIIDNFGVLFNHGYVLPIIVNATFILQIPILILIFLVSITAKKIDFDVRSKKSIEKAVSQFSMLNQLLLSSLQILAILVVFSVLTTSGLQQSIKSAITVTTFDIFPKEISYVYGLFFSLFLAIVYVPSHLYLKDCQNKIKYDMQNEIETNDSVLPEWYKEILSKISSGGSALDSLKLSLTVLAPLISSFLPEQLRLFG